jgi:hypothetical protein
MQFILISSIPAIAAAWQRRRAEPLLKDNDSARPLF